MSRTPDRSAARVALASAIGATVEWYDFFIYGTAAGLVFDRLYFGAYDGTLATLFSFGTFAAGFLARPVGSVLFGHFGDRLGRKHVLLTTITIMGVSTVAIGCLPSADTLGWAAPVVLVALRLLQGLGVGGEYGGAVLMSVESAPARRRAFFGSWAAVGVPAGLCLASAAFYTVSLLPDDAFYAWGWRACFWASIVLVALGFWLRTRVLESPVFAEAQQDGVLEPRPGIAAFRDHARTIVLCMGTRWIEGLAFNLFSVYLLTHCVKTLGLSQSNVLLAITAAALVGAVVTPLVGGACDRVGRRRVAIAGSALGLGVYPFALLLVSQGTLVGVWCAMLLGLGLIYAWTCAPLAAWWSEQFPAPVRYTAIGSIYQLSGIVASGLTPLIATILVSWGGGSLVLVGVYCVAVSFVSLVCAVMLPERRPEFLSATETDDVASATAGGQVEMPARMAA